MINNIEIKFIGIQKIYLFVFYCNRTVSEQLILLNYIHVSTEENILSFNNIYMYSEKHLNFNNFFHQLNSTIYRIKNKSASDISLNFTCSL